MFSGSWSWWTGKICSESKMPVRESSAYIPVFLILCDFMKFLCMGTCVSLLLLFLLFFLCLFCPILVCLFLYVVLVACLLLMRERKKGRA